MKTPYTTSQTQVSRKKTPQVAPIPGKTMVQNAAGGFVFELPMWEKFKQFLMLGTEGGSYYIGERELTIKNAQAVMACINHDGVKAVAEIVEISKSGRALKNEPSIFALALACSSQNKDTRQAAYKAIPLVARTGTHLFHLMEYLKDHRGWSRGLRTGIAGFFNTKNDSSLAYQMVKYRQRDGWTFKDVIRLSHPKPSSKEHADLFQWAVGKKEYVAENKIVKAYEELASNKFSSKSEVDRGVELIKENSMPWETIPTEALNKPAVWEALIPSMGTMALIRNLAKITSLRMVDSNTSSVCKEIVKKLTDQETILKSKIHPISIFIGFKNYSAGHGFRGSLSWNPNGNIVAALQDAMMLSMKCVEPLNKDLLVAVDISGSMSASVSNTNISAREAALAMAYVLLQTEKHLDLCSFSSRAQLIGVNKKMSLREFIGSFPNGGSTNGAAPLELAYSQKTKYDGIFEFTDTDTWAGDRHVCQAFSQYKNVQKDAKFITFQTTSNGATVSDPDDKNMTTICGYDPSLLAYADYFMNKK